MSGFNKGDKVRITPKNGGETVIVGIVELRTSIRGEWAVTVTSTEGGQYIDTWFVSDNWNIEVIEPTTLDIMQSLGVFAVVAAKGWCPYIKTDGGWYEVGDNGRTWAKSDVEVAGYIERYDFQVLSEGIR